MKLLSIFIITLSLNAYNLHAATFTSVASGDWDDPATWGGSVPNLNNNDLIIISTGHDVVRNGDLTLGNRITFQFFGALTIIGTLEVDNQLELIIYPGGSFTTTNLTTDNQASIDISGGGSATITNDFTGGNQTDVNVDGSLEVGGNINVGNQSDLTGSGTVTVGGTCDDENSGSFCDSGPLPVELLTFTANPNENSIILRWSTASELNNDYFTLEKSHNGRDFQVMGKVEGNGTKHTQTDYSYTDKNPFLGLSYYRLSQTDFDGTSEVFPAISILFSPSSNLRVYPNPIRNNALRIQSTGYQENEAVNLHLYNIYGQMIISKKLNADSYGNLETSIQFADHWEEGHYILELTSSKGKDHFKVHRE